MDLPDPIVLARDMLAANPENPATSSKTFDPLTGEHVEDPVVDIEVVSVEVRVVHTWVITNASGARRSWSVAHNHLTGEVLRDTWEGLPPGAPSGGS